MELKSPVTQLADPKKSLRSRKNQPRDRMIGLKDNRGARLNRQRMWN